MHARARWSGMCFVHCILVLHYVSDLEAFASALVASTPRHVPVQCSAVFVAVLTLSPRFTRRGPAVLWLAACEYGARRLDAVSKCFALLRRPRACLRHALPRALYLPK